jgi:hypothetical protein
VGEVRNSCRVLVGKPEAKRPLGKTEGRIILKWIFGKRVERCGLDAPHSG